MTAIDRQETKRHFAAIVAADCVRHSNAHSEATNNKIKLIVRTAFGFRNVDNLLPWLCSPAPSFAPLSLVDELPTHFIETLILL